MLIKKDMLVKVGRIGVIGKINKTGRIDVVNKILTIVIKLKKNPGRITVLQ